jgi:hypothetical protein
VPVAVPCRSQSATFDAPLATEGKGTVAEGFVAGLRADPNWRVVEVADGHLAPVTAPQLTAEALLSLV